MNEDADTGRWEDECPNWMSAPTSPNGPPAQILSTSGEPKPCWPF